MKILTASLLLSLTIWGSPAFSQTDQRTIYPVELFTTALQKFKTKDYVGSRQIFSELLVQRPNDTSLLYNIGLVEATDNHPERAYAYWRKALYLSPGHGPSLEGISTLKGNITNHSWAMWIYWRIPIAILCLLTLFFWFCAGALIVRNISRSKKDLKVQWAGVCCCVFFFIVFASLSTHDYMLLFHSTEGTVMSGTPAFASPSNEAPSLFDFKEGDDVQVLRTQNGWLQVQKSETAVGWVKNTSLLIHSGI
jgi:hypothetical protein